MEWLVRVKASVEFDEEFDAVTPIIHPTSNAHKKV